ncbi:hypothetical protein V8C44DRAFT_94147 [Trichoderma aethiopicum]
MACLSHSGTASIVGFSAALRADEGLRHPCRPNCGVYVYPHKSHRWQDSRLEFHRLLETGSSRHEATEDRGPACAHQLGGTTGQSTRSDETQELRREMHSSPFESSTYRMRAVNTSQPLMLSAQKTQPEVASNRRAGPRAAALGFPFHAAIQCHDVAAQSAAAFPSCQCTALLTQLRSCFTEYCGFETTCCAGADLTSTELCFRITSRIMLRRRELY